MRRAFFWKKAWHEKDGNPKIVFLLTRGKGKRKGRTLMALPFQPKEELRCFIFLPLFLNAKNVQD
jgi:hypothetical protein